MPALLKRLIGCRVGGGLMDLAWVLTIAWVLMIVVIGLFLINLLAAND
jgi:hypothetical protein